MTRANLPGSVLLPHSNPILWSDVHAIIRLDAVEINKLVELRQCSVDPHVAHRMGVPRGERDEIGGQRLHAPDGGILPEGGAHGAEEYRLEDDRQHDHDPLQADGPDDRIIGKGVSVFARLHDTSSLLFPGAGADVGEHRQGHDDAGDDVYYYV